MATRGHVAARAGVALLHVPRVEDLLILDHHHARAVAALLVGPDARGDVGHRVDEVLVAIAADHAVRTLRRIAADGHGYVEQQVEPVGRLLDPRATLRPDGAIVLATPQDPLEVVHDVRERWPGW